MPSETTPPPTAEAASPPATGAPAPSTCELHQSNWDSPTARTLRSASGRAFAAILSADELRFVADGEATAEFTSFGLRLRTTPRPGDLPVYTRGELVFGGVLQAGNTPLMWTSVGGPSLRVAPPKDRRVRFVDAPTVDVACDTLALEESYSDLAVPDSRLRPRGPIAVAATAGGPPVLHLHLKRAVPVKRLADAGSQVKIAWPIADGALAESTVSGWVEARLVEPLKDSTEGEFLARGLSLEGSAHWDGCGAEHPLYVDTGRGAEPVGEILAGTRVRMGPRRGELVVVDVEGPWVRQNPPPLRLRPGAKFLLAPADAADCSR
ncbi:hypothetical protein SAMN02745121_07979 [Nannocystis exedens]|uniref:Uncharacterized protein n=1 Tax=Nannocystis exedens TaxID=54 RepID=A0A1I2HGW3_9BACT|nr:hypothetical protein [Nannocystis exedens]PCC74155.1 hypothetical protein NAEX_07244 [Nannocystis exedens]SFF29384.1 hypothetical protein SAMN02745121_07979 [Nannocystis exedens]